MDDETKKPVALTHDELRTIVGRSKATISAWQNGRDDPLGDKHLEGEWIGKPGSKDRRYVTTPERFGVLKDWLEVVERLRRRAPTPPPHIKQGDNRGNENVMPDDIMTRDLEVEGLGPCKLFMRNRAWLYVFDSENHVNRVQASEQLMAKLTELNVGEFWPFPDEDALRLVYGLEFPKPVKAEESSD